MPSPSINSPEALDAATAAAMLSRRKKLLRIAEGAGSRMRLVYMFAAFIVICAVASFLDGDRRAATIIALQAVWLIGFVVISNKMASGNEVVDVRLAFDLSVLIFP